MPYRDPSDRMEQICFLLSNHRRRIIIRYLMDHEKLSLRDLAAHIAELESTDTKQSYIYVNLYQDHAPKLANHDIAIYNDQEKSLQRGDCFHDAAQILDCADRVLG